MVMLRFFVILFVYAVVRDILDGMVLGFSAFVLRWVLSWSHAFDVGREYRSGCSRIPPSVRVWCLERDM